jgi:hypothetical protein
MFSNFVNHIMRFGSRKLAKQSSKLPTSATTW